LELDAEDLNNGQLTTRLVGIGTLNHILGNESKTMYNKGFELCLATSKDVHVASNFDFVRRASNLDIYLRLPRTKLGRKRVDINEIAYISGTASGTVWFNN
jgi:hypothetical protein